MINVELFYDDDNVRGFVVKGHAKFAPKGEDLVCASVSALSQTAILGLDAFMTVKPLWKINEDGYLECWLPDIVSPKDMQNAQVIIGTMEIGLKNIEESYEQYLKVGRRRCV
ncbi:MAG: ribosomal-processing cysteine protease Prp [Clostridia bacterium]|nr:ribosomal-processing cysteine protease Prp [Clostridia bacterium]MDD4048073.1 ribosomal-processing cysteine protease Prp [Clostridia bacterium]